MTTAELIGIIVTLLGGGGVWSWMSSRARNKVEAQVMATKSALEALQMSLDVMRRENETLRAQIGELRDVLSETRAHVDELTTANARAQEIIAQLTAEIENEEKRRSSDAQALQVQVSEVQRYHAAETARLRREYEQCRDELLQTVQALERR